MIDKKIPMYHDLVYDWFAYLLKKWFKYTPDNWDTDKYHPRDLDELNNFYNINSQAVQEIFLQKLEMSSCPCVQVCVCNENIYKNDIFESNIKSNKIYFADHVVSEVFYKSNSLGFRSNEFKNKQKLLVAGCSHTYGSGLPEDLRWSNQISKLLNWDHDNLSIPGGSCVQIINHLFKYFEEYGNPEYLFCLFPDFLRVWVPQSEKTLATNYYLDSRKKEKNENRRHQSRINIASSDGFLSATWVNSDSYSFDEKFVKLPVDPQKILTPEYSYWLNMQYIHMLSSYCNAAGIKFIWSTWSKDLADIFKIFENEKSITYKNYLDLNLKNINNDLHDTCHQNLKEYNEEFFYHANDFNGGELAHIYPHYGSHLHAHIAEGFIGEAKRKYEI